MVNLGFKKLTFDNWLEPDKVSTSFSRFSTSNGKIHAITGKQWMDNILKFSLTKSVPRDIHALFEVARGALAYGYFFYPLHTLACEQLFRVADAAVAYRCKAIKTSCSTNTFEKRLKLLMSKKIILKPKESIWLAIRELRNIASHPESQSIFVPGQVIMMLERIAGEINSLFS